MLSEFHQEFLKKTKDILNKHNLKELMDYYIFINEIPTPVNKMQRCDLRIQLRNDIKTIKELMALGWDEKYEYYTIDGQTSIYKERNSENNNGNIKMIQLLFD